MDNREGSTTHWVCPGEIGEGQRGVGSWGEIAWGEMPDIGIENVHSTTWKNE